LGIDEISLKKRHKQFALIISDIERRFILDVLPIRDKQALEKWIYDLSEQQRQTIRYASIDMWAPYYYAVRNRLPGTLSRAVCHPATRGVETYR